MVVTGVQGPRNEALVPIPPIQSDEKALNEDANGMERKAAESGE